MHGKSQLPACQDAYQATSRSNGSDSSPNFKLFAFSSYSSFFFFVFFFHSSIASTSKALAQLISYHFAALSSPFYSSSDLRNNVRAETLKPRQPTTSIRIPAWTLIHLQDGFPEAHWQGEIYHNRVVTKILISLLGAERAVGNTTLGRHCWTC
jgi:hypothetical protein